MSSPLFNAHLAAVVSVCLPPSEQQRGGPFVPRRQLEEATNPADISDAAAAAALPACLSVSAQSRFFCLK